MRIVELFAGLEGWSSAAGAEDVVVTSDLEPRFESTITADVLEPDLGARILERLGGKPDVVLASPPCEAFSVLTIGRNWTRPNDYPPHAPKTDEARLALRLVERTLELIAELEPAFYVVENPRAKLRKLPVVAHLERRTVTYCSLGERFQKPTDLWGGFPPSLALPPPCNAGDPCHVAAPRGSRTGIQGDGVRRKGTDGHGSPDRAGRLRDQKRRVHYGTSAAVELAALRAKVPLELSRLVLDAARRDLEAGRKAEPIPTLFDTKGEQA